MANKGIEVQINELLEEYKEIPKEIAEKCSREAARSAVNKLKATSPKRPGGGEYASGWSARKIRNGYVVYNRSKPGLTHLLERGHTTRNKYGTYRRTPAHVHIAPVETEATEEYVEAVRRELNKL